MRHLTLKVGYKALLKAFGSGDTNDAWSIEQQSKSAKLKQTDFLGQ
jgi:hypothetical protein